MALLQTCSEARIRPVYEKLQYTSRAHLTFWLEFALDLGSVSILLLAACTRVVFARAADGKLGSLWTFWYVLCTEATTPLMQMSTHKQRMSTGTSFPVLMAVALKKNFLMQDLGSTILRAKCNQKAELRYQPPQTVERVVFDKLVHL